MQKICVQAIAAAWLICASVLLSGCANIPWSANDLFNRSSAESEQNLTRTPQDPLVTKTFFNIPANTEVLGEMQVVDAHQRNTFSDIARQYNLGYAELKIANPGVDPWLPGADTPIYLPTMFILPPSPRKGVVVNLATMRLVQYENSARENHHLRIQNYPIGIGREGWATPTGEFYITEKARDPNWYPPASVRAEHAEMGDPLPAIVPPGPENPLGRFKMRLSEPDYLIHGTNKPSGVGMRVSHGCIRLFPEDISTLFESVPSKTQVTIINEPVLAGWRNGQLFLEVHPLLAEDDRTLEALAEVAIGDALRKSDNSPTLNREAIARIVSEQRGIPFPISAPTASVEIFLANARPVKNIVPLPEVHNTASR